MISYHGGNYWPYDRREPRIGIYAGTSVNVKEQQERSRAQNKSKSRVILTGIIYNTYFKNHKTFVKI